MTTIAQDLAARYLKEADGDYARARRWMINARAQYEPGSFFRQSYTAAIAELKVLCDEPDTQDEDR